MRYKPLLQFAVGPKGAAKRHVHRGERSHSYLAQLNSVIKGPSAGVPPTQSDAAQGMFRLDNPCDGDGAQLHAKIPAISSGRCFFTLR
jgi:hypothetical protein